MAMLGMTAGTMAAHKQRMLDEMQRDRAQQKANRSEAAEKIMQSRGYRQRDPDAKPPAPRRRPGLFGGGDNYIRDASGKVIGVSDPVRSPPPRQRTDYEPVRSRSGYEGVRQDIIGRRMAGVFAGSKPPPPLIPEGARQAPPHETRQRPRASVGSGQSGSR